uniref:G_PROTEIN_RECEP_F1_2 domain-containing protein n=1 Tax=Steinernema glaseri TaxID=37863 RepID=A0A1I7YZ88_9BILA
MPDVKGRGYPIQTDVIAGSLLLSICLLAVLLGVTNLILIRKMKVFHNAFGWFAASRTFGEVCCNLVHVLCTAPVTLISCAVQLAISVNRSVAVCFPLRYKFIFTRRMNVSCIVASWIFGAVIIAGYVVAVCFPLRYKFIFTRRTNVSCIVASWIFGAVIIAGYAGIPCNLIGYSPQIHSYTIVPCTKKAPVFFGILSTRLCFSFCALTLLLDMLTFFKIVNLKKAGIPCNLIGYSPPIHSYTIVPCTTKAPVFFGILSTRLCFSFCALTLLLDTLTFFKIVNLKKAEDLQNKGYATRFQADSKQCHAVNSA